MFITKIILDKNIFIIITINEIKKELVIININVDTCIYY